MKNSCKWLVDRAEISDLLIEFGRTLDDHAPEQYAALCAEDGIRSSPGACAGRAVSGSPPASGTPWAGTALSGT